MHFFPFSETHIVLFFHFLFSSVIPVIFGNPTSPIGGNLNPTLSKGSLLSRDLGARFFLGRGEEGGGDKRVF